MKKYLLLLLLISCFGTFANEYDPPIKNLESSTKIDECCEKTVQLRVFVEDYMLYFFGSGTARACVESQTTNDPRNMEIACGTAQSAAGQIAARAVEKEIAEYRP